MECTLSIIKPKIIKKNMIGFIYFRFEQSGFKIIAAKMSRLNKNAASEFYIEHKKKPFFDDLIKSITTGPVMLQVLAGNNIVQRYRDLIGATNPLNALTGTIRADYGDNITENAIHGSDSILSAKREIAFFFNEKEIFLK